MTVLGIDYGTSTTAMATLTPMGPKMLTDDHGEEIIPSVIAFTPTGRTFIGKAGRNRVLIDPTNSIHSFKRVLGKSWHAPDVTSFRNQYPFEMERSERGEPRFVTRAGQFTAEELLCRFLAHARNFDAVRLSPPDIVVVAVPETADLRQQKATIVAAQEAGFPEPDVIAEPAAAVLAYLHREPSPQQLLVYDFGGGTFDAAVVRWDGQRATVLSSAGDSFLGGDDLDYVLATKIADQILTKHRWDVRTDVRAFRVLSYLCEQAKVRLSIAEQTAINLSAVEAVLEDQTVLIDREVLISQVGDTIERTFQVCDNALGFLGLKPRELAGVVMAGGTTYMPLVQQMVTERMGVPLLVSLPPDRVVATGAAIFAGMRGRRS